MTNCVWIQLPKIEGAAKNLLRGLDVFSIPYKNCGGTGAVIGNPKILLHIDDDYLHNVKLITHWWGYKICTIEQISKS